MLQFQVLSGSDEIACWQTKNPVLWARDVQAGPKSYFLGKFKIISIW
jgi:hypothetical protein